VLLAAAALALRAPAQDKAPAPKKAPRKVQPSAHRKPTPEQIREFKQLAKKQRASETK
jgi:hypothetical protein